MNSKDLELAGKIGELLSNFSREWEDYQAWLRDIVSSRSVLMERHPTWKATVIFRWRLFYFAFYVTSAIVFHQVVKKIQRFSHRGDSSQVKALSEGDININQSSRFERFQYILQRVATILAIVELTLCSIACFTGILLAFYYQPTALGAYESLTTIANEVTNGTLILSLHNIAGNGLIVFALVQIVVMFLGRQFLASWLTAWVSGIGLAIAAIGLSWTAILLDWEQMSFWRFKVELKIVGSIPAIGSSLRDILLGGDGIGSITLQHMYALHSYILAIVAIFLSITHLGALICQEQHWKPEDKQLRITKLCSESPAKKDSSL